MNIALLLHRAARAHPHAPALAQGKRVLADYATAAAIVRGYTPGAHKPGDCVHQDLAGACPGFAYCSHGSLRGSRYPCDSGVMQANVNKAFPDGRDTSTIAYTGTGVLIVISYRTGISSVSIQTP